MERKNKREAGGKGGREGAAIGERVLAGVRDAKRAYTAGARSLISRRGGGGEGWLVGMEL